MTGTIPTAWQHGAHGRLRLTFCFQVTNWFTKSLNYQYDPLMHGNVAEWLSDLISISFTEPPKYFKRSMRSIKVPQHACCTILAVTCPLRVHSDTSFVYRCSTLRRLDLQPADGAQSSCTHPCSACICRRKM